MNPEEKFEKLLSVFANEMVDAGELTKNSSDDYKTYLRNLRNALNEKHGENWLESKLEIAFDGADIIEKGYAENGYVEIVKAINALRGKAKNSAESKQWSDWVSAFHKLNDFLEDSEDDEDEHVSSEVSTEYPEQVTVFDVLARSELMTKFRGRLRTQQRYYECEVEGEKVGVIIPSRAISKIAGNRMWWTETQAISNALNTMTVLIENDRKIYPVEFKDIESIEALTDHTFWAILSDERQGLIMTATGGGKKPQLWEGNCKKSIWSSLSIDHKKPLRRIVEDLLRKKRITGLSKLNSLFEEHADKKPGVDRKDARRTRNKGFEEWCANCMDEELRKQVESEFISLFTADGASFEIIDRRENSRKGDRE